MSLHILYNIVPWGFILLLLYIFIDIFLDFFRKPKMTNTKRIIFYSFLFYVLSLIQIKFGGITLPILTQPYNFRVTVPDGLFDEYYFIYKKTTMNVSSAIFYNLLLFIPLGIYLSILFKLNSLKKVVPTVILSCIAIEILRFAFESFGLVLALNNNMFIKTLLFNILGGILGYLLIKAIFGMKNRLFAIGH
ncbi:MAG: hypothetical protein ACI383_07760 [Rummeliibacillus sp.]